MTRIEEGYLAFEFGENWSIFKLDEHPDYRNRIEKIDGTKAVDFLGIFKKELCLIEVKDFREHRIENKERLLSGALAIEMAQKVRDSLACIIGAYRSSSDSEHWLPYATLLCNKEKNIKIIIWIEHDLPNYPPQREKVKKSVRSKVFKQKLTWLTRHVLVCDSNAEDLSDVKVKKLPYV